MVYDNRHRTFLQAVMHRGAVLDQDAAELCLKIFVFNDFFKSKKNLIHYQRVKVSSITSLINEKLAPIAMSIKAGICELTGDKYWSVVGTTHEETLDLGSEFSQNQTALLLAIYSEIINAEDGCVSSTDCLNLTKSIDHKLSMGDADVFVKNMIKKKWLTQQEGYIYMGVRSIVELMPYFRETYQENFHNCGLCREIIFHGHKCDNCDKVYHNYCIARYTSRQKKNKCPHCKNSLDMSHITVNITPTQDQEGEDEPMDIEENMDASCALGASKRSKKRTKTH